MATGVPVVTTNLGIEGLEAKRGTHVLAAEGAEELSDLVCNALLDRTLYRKVALNARKFIEDNYDWKIISEKLNKVYISSL
jgi:glycosyltransferase involved in cell wall biosynthesis